MFSVEYRISQLCLIKWHFGIFIVRGLFVIHYGRFSERYGRF